MITVSYLSNRYFVALIASDMLKGVIEYAIAESTTT